MTWKIPLFKMYYDENDIKSVVSIIKRGMFWGLSSETLQLEKLIAKVVGVKYCVVFNSGTSALHAIMIAYGFKNPDEIIVPSFTFISTANSILFVNAIPKFGDIEDDGYGLDPEDVQSKISSKTKAILPIHYAGNMCKIEKIKKIATESKLLLIEDAAEALGSSINGKMAVSFGDAGILSFAWNKVITTGEGGAVLTNSKKIFERLVLIRSHGRVDKENYFMSSSTPEYLTLGYNWRISAMTAALGISQLQKLNKLVDMRIKNANYLTKKLSKIPFIETPRSSNNVKHTYMMYTIRIKAGKKTRNELSKFLTKRGIQTKIMFEPIHLTKFYRKKFGYKNGFLKNTERISNEILSLPMYPHLKKTEMDFIIENIKEFSEKIK